MNRPPTYQVPKADHPWRQYKDKAKHRDDDRKDIISIHEFLITIVENWDEYKVITKSTTGYSRRIATLPQKDAALWISSMLKKYYVDRR